MQGADGYLHALVSGVGVYADGEPTDAGALVPPHLHADRIHDFSTSSDPVLPCRRVALGVVPPAIRNG